MAELNSHQPEQAKRGRMRKHSMRQDMTPMVDLAFLLLTFFMLTAVFLKPAILPIVMPAPGPPGPVNNAVTVLIGHDGLYYYTDQFDASDLSRMHATNYSPTGLRRELMEKNKNVIQKIQELDAQLMAREISEAEYKRSVEQVKKDRSNKGIFVQIKATDDASYAHVVQVLDEMKICNVVNYALVDITKEEKQALAVLTTR
jgi:biopolymer transport protein ExbD